VSTASLLLLSRRSRHLSGRGGVEFDFRFGQPVDRSGSNDMVAGPATMQKRPNPATARS
jgi:hypothetical protein